MAQQPGGQRRQDGGVAVTLRAEIRAGVRLAALLGLFGAFGPFAVFVMAGIAYGYVVPTGSLLTLWGLVAGACVAAVIVVALDHMRDAALIGISHRVARRLAAPALLAATSRPGADQPRAAGHVLSDIEEVRRGITGPVCTLVLDLFLVPMLLLLLSFFHWIFLVFALLSALLALVLGLIADRLMRSTLADANNESIRAQVFVADAVRCAEAVQAMGLLRSLVRRWAGSLARSALQLRSIQSMSWAVSAAMATLYKVSHIGVLVIGATMLLDGGDIGMGMIVALLVTSRLLRPFSGLGETLSDVATLRAAWWRLDQLLREAHAESQRRYTAWPCPEGRLSVERVTFAHSGTGRPLLRDVSFRVQPGEAVALAGPPGSGKSTLLRVILGVERVVAGSVLLDGHSTMHWDREDLGTHVGFLAQDPALPGGTVADAIARLAPDPDMAAVIRAARLAGAERMIVGLPRGYATPLDSSIRLSMGQRQRIALARAVYGDPRLILLDEPAAYLDEEGEAAVARLITALTGQGKTVVFTSHREGLLRVARRVLHLEERQPAIAAPPQAPRLSAPKQSRIAQKGTA